MVTKKRPKNSRARAQTTHGFGSMKKNRGAGNRGGRGNAGSGKRGDAKKPSFWKDKKKFGMYGFTKKNAALADVTINLTELSTLALHEKSTTLDLTKLGYTKLLGNGVIGTAYKVTVEKATERAIAKIEAAKGSVQTSSSEE